MLFNSATFIGIDPTAGRRPFTFAALDNDLRPLAIGAVHIDEILAFVAGQRQAWLAICAPRSPNKGLMARQEIRQVLSPMPTPGRWVDFRLADYLIRQRNISIPQTPALEEECPNWMRMGFNLYRSLAQLGYQVYPTAGADLQSLEVYPYACYSVLLEVLPFSKYTLEGRLQRQLILHERNVKVADPMGIFEEFTRFKLLKGVLPIEQLYSTTELDALVAAYTAWLAANHPDQISILGDAQEGQIVLPVVNLKPRY